MAFAVAHPEITSRWESSSSTLVLLSVASENWILDWQERFSGSYGAEPKAPHTIFFEPDIDSYTAIAVVLNPEQAKYLSHLPLLLRGGVKVND